MNEITTSMKRIMNKVKDNKKIRHYVRFGFTNISIIIINFFMRIQLNIY